MPQSERRGAPRIVTRLPLTLTQAARQLVTWTENLSVSGAYCVVKRFLPPMTKLQIRLELPDRLGSRAISCEGVVVRAQPPAPSPRQSAYHVAVFFSGISDRSRALLAEYVQRHPRRP